MPQYPEILVLRHGQTEWNKAKRMQGRLDSPLTRLGVCQAQQQRDTLANIDTAQFDLFCSPQGRAVATAQIALGQDADRAQHDDRLQEIDLGPWNGKSTLEISNLLERSLKPFEIYWASPTETLQMMSVRCRDFLNHLTKPSIVVCHGITSRVLRCIAMEKPWEEFAEIPGGQGNIHRVINKEHSSLNLP